MIRDPQHSLLLGSLELAGTPAGWTADYAIETLADDATWGNPQPIEVAVKSLLQDGSIVATTGHDNREAFVRITLKSSDGVGLALAEQAVNAEVGRLNTLTWTPMDGFGPPTVFEVVTSSLEHVFDNTDELRLTRTYGLRLVCRPFARSAVETISMPPAPPVGAVTVTEFEPADSAAKWTASHTLAQGTGGIYNNSYVTTQAPDSRAGVLWLEWNGSQDATNLPYLRVYTSTPDPAVRVDGVELTRLAAGDGYHYYRLAGTSFAKVRVDRPAGWSTHTVYGLALTNALPGAGTRRQLRRTVAVGGSARTQATVEVAGSAGLGWALVYTGSGAGRGAIPLRPYLSSAAVAATTDAALLSGAYNALVGNNSIVFSVPAADVAPGTYAVWAMMKSSAARSAVTFFASATLYVNGTVVGSGGNPPLYLDLTTAYEPIPLRLVNLPPSVLADPTSAEIRLSVSGSSTFDWQVDEVWLFNVDDGAVTVLNAETSRRLWLEPATIGDPKRRVMVGTDAQQADAFHASGTKVRSWGAHSFPPGEVSLFTATQGALDAEVTLRYFKRWHTHAAE